MPGCSIVWVPVPLERSTIQHLLPSHRELLEHHACRIRRLLGVATLKGIRDLGIIVADVRGEFGTSCVTPQVGLEFVVPAPDGRGAVVIPLGMTGLIVLLGAIIPEALPVALQRHAGSIVVVVVDADDEPAIVMLEPNELASTMS